MATLDLRRLAGALLCLTAALGTLSTSSSALALDRSSFPIRVFIDPTVRTVDAPEKPGEPLSEEKRRWVQQGLLDWVRVLLFAPGRNAPEEYIVILHKQSEEQQARLLQNAGIFKFVDRRDRADLAIESFNRPRPRESDGDGIQSRYAQADRLPIGKIQIVFKGSQSEYNNEFTLRGVVMHEAGHALGLAHLSAQRCNLMAPKDYTCAVPFPAECRADASGSRCVTINTVQVQFVKSALAAAPGMGPRSPMADIQDYRDGVIRRIRNDLLALADLKSSGKVVLKLGALGAVEEASVEGSFGNSATDAKVLERIHKLAPFGPFPAIWKDPAIQFSFSVNP